ncbi:MAG: Uncharacterised protein [Opitutia bacterium UBA7350]|nr:MAG: Uncharacterised protein [Opitutae bacterium UBA7350]
MRTMHFFRRWALYFSLTCFAVSILCAGGQANEGGNSVLPKALSAYAAVEADYAAEKGIEAGALSFVERLQARAADDPMNWIASLIFFLAIVHTFLAGKIMALAHKEEHKHQKMIEGDPRRYPDGKAPVSFKATALHFFGEIEAIFGIWLVPLLLAITMTHGWHDATAYIDSRNFTEPMFVVVIMAIAASRPVMVFAEGALRSVASLGNQTPAAWWLSILVIAPLLGSFITEPAAMTIAALLLGQQFYRYDPSPTFKYASLGLLFVNISVGGTLTHFAAPPVLMVAGTWEWDIAFMFTTFGWRSVLGILAVTAVYYFVFRKHFGALQEKADAEKAGQDSVSVEPVPQWVIFIHLIFLAWTVFTLHHPSLFIGGFLFFLAFNIATEHHQTEIRLKAPILVGFFLAGLVTHGGMQGWWIAPVLSALGEVELFVGATILTAFNDNAAITFLASQVPDFANGVDGSAALQYAVVAGAVTGGGLTVIANAPNPAGQSILSKYFPGGVSPAKLLLGALFPTLVLAIMFMVLPH